MLLSTQDAYAIARAAAGEKWDDLDPSAAVKLLLANTAPKDRTTLIRMLGPEVQHQILAIDPRSEPPARRERQEQDEQLHVPELPAEAALSNEATIASLTVGGWLDEFTAWASQRTPMTPRLFLEAGAIWALGLAVARRSSINLGFAHVYPHLYILWIARTSIFKKSTGMDAIADVINEAMPHMLLPEENTPESFISALSGRKPNNYDQLDPWERKIDDWGRLHAAQRGILLDEASSLFGSAKKDYMQGMAEMLMRLYDAPKRYTRNIRSEGKVVIRNASLSILGATTPAALRRNTNIESWETGELARYLLLFPDGPLPYDPGSGDNYKPPADLVKRLAALHRALPKPPDVLALKGDEPPEQAINHAHISPDAFAAYERYARALTYDMLLTNKIDPQLHPNYSRHHIQALKIALALACIDWSDAGAKDTITITLGHWARAQQIAEKHRASLHRLLHDIVQSQDNEIETKLMNHLAIFPDGETLRDLSRRTHIDRKSIEGALKLLIESGLVAAEQNNRTTIYKLA